jgi:D-threo-aldose 1-dehydrogenase
MEICVPGLSASSTHLGFGCSQLMGGITRRQSVALLETAFDAGIRHFDTAPSYGYGRAESVLGEVLRSRREQVTIATKFGILPPRNKSVLGIARGIALPLVKHLPGIKSRLSRAARGLATRPTFSAGALGASIDASLAALRTDYIDILLLHEAVVADLSDDLFVELERNVEAGKIRTFGIGSEAASAAQIYRVDRRFCRIMQFEWSVLNAEKPRYSGSFLITHRSLSENVVRLRAWLGANPQVEQTWSSELGLDIGQASILSRLMLSAARAANSDGIVLFSSRNPDNIRTNAALMLDNSDFRNGAAFASLVARDAKAALVGGVPINLAHSTDLGASTG